MVQRSEGLWIRHSGKREGCFVHHSSIKGDGYKSLAEGQQVEFEIEQGPKASRLRM